MTTAIIFIISLFTFCLIMFWIALGFKKGTVSLFGLMIILAPVSYCATMWTLNTIIVLTVLCIIGFIRNYLVTGQL